eukprot:261146-Lingulodinium_polyedra.AAC.1
MPKSATAHTSEHEKTSTNGPWPSPRAALTALRNTRNLAHAKPSSEYPAALAINSLHASTGSKMPSL